MSEDSSVDIDDMNYDSLREQAEQLDLLKYITGEKDEEIPEEVKEKPLSAKKVSIKKKTKRIEDDIQKLKVEKYNKIREYNSQKKSKIGKRKAGPRVKTNKITEMGSLADSSHKSDRNVSMTAAERRKLEEIDSAKERVLKNKQKKKMEEQKKKEMELLQICKQNQAVNAEARMRAKNQYRPSSAMQNIFGDKKKIEEEYSLYDHPVDDDMDDELLESIIEDVDAENEEDKDFKEKIIAIDMRIKEKQVKLAETQKQMQKITFTIDKSKPETPPQDIAVKEEDKDDSDSDDEELAHLLEDNDDEEDEEPTHVYKAFEENRVLVKLRDKIKMLKHRCEAALGFNLFEKAYKLIKRNEEGLRSKLCELIGEENIGFYVVFDNILFLEKKKKELMPPAK